MIENSSGTFTEKYIYLDQFLIAKVDTDGNKFAIHPDHLGSTDTVTDSAGVVVERNFFSPYGEQLEGQFETRFGYEGMEFDAKTQDTDFHFRKYKPHWGRFTQPDDIIASFYNPQALNRYAFEYNNPYRHVDRTGHIPLDIVADIAFIGYDLHKLASEGPGEDNVNFKALQTDILFAAIPFVSGGGAAVRASKHVKQVQNAEKATESLKIIDEAKKIVNKGEKLRSGAKLSDGKEIFLELGNDKEGLLHIIQRRKIGTKGNDFLTFGEEFNSIDNILNLIFGTVRHGKAYKQGSGSVFFQEVTNDKFLKVVVGSKGQIITAHPISRKGYLKDLKKFEN